MPCHAHGCGSCHNWLLHLGVLFCTDTLWQACGVSALWQSIMA